MRLLFRQGIVRYQTPTFLSIGGSYVSLVVNDIQCIITLADGTKDYLYVEQSSVSNAWGPITPATDQWLYWDIDRRTGVRTFGITLVEPVAQPSEPPSPATDQHWFDTSVKQMKVWNGVRWLDKIRVFACELSNGSVPISMSINSPAFDGTQAGLTTVDTFAGQILFDANTDQPLKTPDHKFITTEDRFATRTISFSDIKLSALILSAEAQQNLSAYTIVKFTGFNEILYADAFTASQLGQFGIIEQDVLVGEFTNVVLEGVITNAGWNWPTVNAPLYSNATGTLVDVAPVPNAAPVAIVVGPQTIIFGSPKNTFNTYSVIVDLATVVDHGLVRLNIPPASALDPVVVGANDPRVTYLDNVTSDVQAQLDAKATDTAVVHLAGIETITGAKTFTGGINAGADPITNVADPVALQDAATKFYVDSVAGTGSHWVAPIRDPDLNDIVSAQPTITSGAVGSTVTYIKYGGVQGESWTQGGASAVVDDGDVAIFTVTNIVGPVGDWVVVQQGPLATDDRFVVAGIHGTIGATLLGMGFANNDLLEFTNLVAPGVITNAANWTTPSGSPPQDGTTALVTDPDSPHYGVTYLYSAAGVEWFQIAGPGTTNIPLNEIVVGTGTDIGSDPDFTYNSTSGRFYVNTTDGFSPSVSFATPGNIALVGASNTSGYGGEIMVRSANGTGAGSGAIINIRSGDAGPTGFNGGPIVLLSGQGPSGAVGQGGNIEITANNGNLIGDGGQVIITSGGSFTGNAGAVTITAGSSATAGDGGSVNITAGAHVGAGNPGDINLTGGAADPTLASTGGNVYLVGGTSGNLIGGVGGQVTLTGGPGGTIANGGTVAMYGGSALTGNGGEAILKGGDSTVAGNGGMATVQAGSGMGALGVGGVVFIDAGMGFGGGTNGSILMRTSALPRLEILADGDWSVGGSAGTSGQVLTSGGAGTPPTWTTPASAVEPLNQMVYGTGAGVDSSPNFTYDSTLGQLWVNTVDGFSAISVASPPFFGAVTIFAPSSSGFSTGGDLRLGAGNSASGAGGDVAIISGAGTTGGTTTVQSGSGTTGGLAQVIGGQGTTTGGSILIEAGSSSSTPGSVTITGGGHSSAGTAGGATIRGGDPDTFYGGPFASHGGPVTVRGGDARTSNNAGTATIRGGNVTIVSFSFVAPVTGGSGGAVTLTGGAGGSPTNTGANAHSATGGTPGSLSVSGAAGSTATLTNAGSTGSATAGAGGAIAVAAGAGGNASITSASGTATAGAGGTLTLSAGSAGTATGGATQVGANGGNVVITAGAASGTGIPGSISFASTYSEKASAPTISAGTLILNMANGNHFNVSLNQNITTLTISNVPTTASAAIGMTIVFTADGTARTITWPASFKWAGGTAPTMTSTLSKIDVVTATTYDNGTSWLATATQNF